MHNQSGGLVDNKQLVVFIHDVERDVLRNDVEGNIGRNPKDRLQMAVFPEGDQGKHAVTHYKVIENLSHVAVVQCQLETGRTHQIRVHMKHIGHPLFNDARYGGDKIIRGTTAAKYTQFVQNCFKMFFNSEIPADMTALIKKWEDYTAAVL